MGEHFFSKLRGKRKGGAREGTRTQHDPLDLPSLLTVYHALQLCRFCSDADEAAAAGFVRLHHSSSPDAFSSAASSPTRSSGDASWTVSTHVSTPGTVYVATRSSAPILETLLDKRSCPPIETLNGARVHAGVYIAVQSELPAMAAALRSAVSRVPGCRVVFTGHGIGGGQALVGMFELLATPGSVLTAANTEAVVFGAPAVFLGRRAESPGIDSPAGAVEVMLPRLMRGAAAAVDGPCDVGRRAADELPTATAAPRVTSFVANLDIVPQALALLPAAEEAVASASAASDSAVLASCLDRSVMHASHPAAYKSFGVRRFVEGQKRDAEAAGSALPCGSGNSNTPVHHDYCGVQATAAATTGAQHTPQPAVERYVCIGTHVFLHYLQDSSGGNTGSTTRLTAAAVPRESPASVSNKAASLVLQRHFPLRSPAHYPEILCVDALLDHSFPDVYYPAVRHVALSGWGALPNRPRRPLRSASGSVGHGIVPSPAAAAAAAAAAAPALQKEGSHYSVRNATRQTLRLNTAAADGGAAVAATAAEAAWCESPRTEEASNSSNCVTAEAESVGGPAAAAAAGHPSSSGRVPRTTRSLVMPGALPLRVTCAAGRRAVLVVPAGSESSCLVSSEGVEEVTHADVVLRLLQHLPLPTEACASFLAAATATCGGRAVPCIPRDAVWGPSPATGPSPGLETLRGAARCESVLDARLKRQAAAARAAAGPTPLPASEDVVLLHKNIHGDAAAAPVLQGGAAGGTSGRPVGIFVACCTRGSDPLHHLVLCPYAGAEDEAAIVHSLDTCVGAVLVTEGAKGGSDVALRFRCSSSGGGSGSAVNGHMGLGPPGHVVRVISFGTRVAANIFYGFVRLCRKIRGCGGDDADASANWVFGDRRSYEPCAAPAGGFESGGDVRVELQASPGLTSYEVESSAVLGPLVWRFDGSRPTDAAVRPLSCLAHAPDEVRALSSGAATQKWLACHRTSLYLSHSCNVPTWKVEVCASPPPPNFLLPPCPRHNPHQPARQVPNHPQPASAPLGK